MKYTIRIAVLLLFTTFLSTPLLLAANPVQSLLERIDKGASKKFVIQKQKSDVDFFELDQQGSKVVVRGNTWVNIASGINWYLKYYCGIQLSWNQMHATLPATLPKVNKKERHKTDLSLRYDFNYCTFSYSMLAGGDRLDGASWHQYATGCRRRGMCMAQYHAADGLFAEGRR